MTAKQSEVVSVADSRLLTGNFHQDPNLFIKEKFFSFSQLIGKNRQHWCRIFENGSWAIFRLTPDKYHYNHVPVTGIVKDIYEINGSFHSCNPGAVVRSITPYSKNRRVVTIIDTDVEGGCGMGHVAMVEVVAMMIGKVVQCYSRERYNDPENVRPGLFVEKGQPKSLFRPGSSTTILIFERDRIQFSKDILQNQSRQDVISRFSKGFGTPIVETDVKVRETIGEAKS